MITVSTVSPDEAQLASRILSAHLPDHVGFEVYLRGQGFAERQPVPGRYPDEWPSPAELRLCGPISRLRSIRSCHLS